jgi:hypothetical protein
MKNFKRVRALIDPTKAMCMAALAAIASVAGASTASASIVGETVNVTARFPDSTTVFANPGNRVVSGGVEYTLGSFAAYNPSFSVDVTGQSLIIASTGGVAFASADFNGFVLDLTSSTQFLSASVDPGSSLLPTSLSFDSDEIFVNFAGLTRLDGFSTTINFTTNAASAVPEPTTWAMMLIGFGAVGYSMRRGRNRQSALAAV